MTQELGQVVKVYLNRMKVGEQEKSYYYHDITTPVGVWSMVLGPRAGH